MPREWAAGTQDSSINIKSTLLAFFDLDLAGSGCPERIGYLESVCRLRSPTHRSSIYGWFGVGKVIDFGT